MEDCSAFQKNENPQMSKAHKFCIFQHLMTSLVFEAVIMK